MGVAFRTWRHTIPEGVSLEPLDRFVGRDGTPITAAMVTGIDIRLYELPVAEPIYELLALAPGNGSTGPIFDTLQTDGRWTRAGEALDRRGYNFRRLITLAQIGSDLKSGSVYRLEIIVHTSTWEDLVSAHEYTVERILGIT